MVTYEQFLSRDPEAALLEGSMHFEERSKVHDAMREIVRRLQELEIPFAVVGGMALYLHNFRRFTEDVDLLVTDEGLRELHEKLEGLGYVPPFANSKHLRDTTTGVRIEFLVAGQFPGDGKPKPISFPDPATASIDIAGIPVLRLDKIIELKLASGLSNANRLKDLADVQEMIKILQLPRDVADKLDASVRAKYLEFWDSIHASPPEE
jgi:hypothetical protein